MRIHEPSHHYTTLIGFYEFGVIRYVVEISYSNYLAIPNVYRSGYRRAG
jgi:hypothetical protein